MLSPVISVVNVENNNFQENVFIGDKRWYTSIMEPSDVADSLASGVRRLMAAQCPPWNQTELADKLGWSRGNVSRMLSAKRAPTSVVLAQLANAFNVELCELLCPAKGKKKRAN
jgi:ribosome-binding protein aMBF1 (putative translation factor)